MDNPSSISSGSHHPQSIVTIARPAPTFLGYRISRAGVWPLIAGKLMPDYSPHGEKATDKRAPRQSDVTEERTPMVLVNWLVFGLLLVVATALEVTAGVLQRKPRKND